MTPLNDHLLPRFHYVHKPNGSPPSRYAGTKPTGPLPKSIDFPLHKQEEPGKFRAIFFGDPQPRNQKEIDYIANDVVAELAGTDAKFGVTLGDIMFDNLDLFGSLNGSIALIGIPWFNVIGNHDLNFEAKVDHLSDETFERVYGPPISPSTTARCTSSCSTTWTGSMMPNGSAIPIAVVSGNANWLS